MRLVNTQSIRSCQPVSMYFGHANQSQSYWPRNFFPTNLCLLFSGSSCCKNSARRTGRQLRLLGVAFLLDVSCENECYSVCHSTSDTAPEVKMHSILEVLKSHIPFKSYCCSQIGRVNSVLDLFKPPLKDSVPNCSPLIGPSRVSLILTSFRLYLANSVSKLVPTIQPFSVDHKFRISSEPNLVSRES